MSTSPTSEPATSPPPIEKRPGWLEIGVGIVALLALEALLVILLRVLHPGPVFAGLYMTAMSAIVAGGAFAVAAIVRVRSWGAFGVRGTSWRWLLIGAVGGLVATLLKFPLISAYTALFGEPDNPQMEWGGLSDGGIAPVLLATLFLGVLTPIGEELLFRGVITTALLRYGAVVGVVGSTVIFALLHGVGVLILAAAIVGLLAGELRRRSGSIWPGVVLHAVFNILSSIGLFVLLPLLG